MSHFMVTVLVLKKDRDRVEYMIEELMAPFDEQLEVPEYERRCWCVGREASKRADEAAAKKFGKWEEKRAEFAKRPEGEQSQEAWEREFVNPHREFEKKLLSADQEKDTPDPKCDTCGGSGKEMTKYNPESKWDWWVIGGRYDGEIQMAYRSDADGGFNFGDDHHQLKNNLATPEFILDHNIIPYAIVTPDGKWHQRGEMGWWGMDSNVNDNWDDEAAKILTEYKDKAYAIGLDCHI